MQLIVKSVDTTNITVPSMLPVQIENSWIAKHSVTITVELHVRNIKEESTIDYWLSIEDADLLFKYPKDIYSR